jgi:ABC-type polysaccharide/polyol phosphate transport system ATPase subunit
MRLIGLSLYPGRLRFLIVFHRFRGVLINILSTPGVRHQKTSVFMLEDLGFIQNKKNIILIGNPGTGKMFLSRCIAYAATQAGIKILFTTTMDMINQPVAAKTDHTLLKLIWFKASFTSSSLNDSNIFFIVPLFFSLLEPFDTIKSKTIPTGL